MRRKVNLVKGKIHFVVKSVQSNGEISTLPSEVTKYLAEHFAIPLSSSNYSANFKS